MSGTDSQGNELKVGDSVRAHGTVKSVDGAGAVVEFFTTGPQWPRHEGDPAPASLVMRVPTALLEHEGPHGSPADPPATTPESAGKKPSGTDAGAEGEPAGG